MGNLKEELIDDNAGNKVEPVLTHVALSVCKVKGEGWSLVSIKYNPETGKVGELVKEHTGEMGDYIFEKFKIESLRRGIFNNCGNE